MILRGSVISIVFILRVRGTIETWYGFIPNKISETDSEFRLNATTSRTIH